MIFIFHGLDFLRRKQSVQELNCGKPSFSVDFKGFSHLPLLSSWDYNYTVGEIAGRRMDCNCGSTECRRRVL